MKHLAYVDPGTGSFVFQVLIGALLAAGVAIKVWWRKIVAFVTRRSPEAPKAPASPEQEK
jgi:hypothetical protein